MTTFIRLILIAFLMLIYSGPARAYHPTVSPACIIKDSEVANDEHDMLKVYVKMHSNCESKVIATGRVFQNGKITDLYFPVNFTVAQGEHFTTDYRMVGIGPWEFRITGVTVAVDKPPVDDEVTVSSGQCDGDNTAYECPMSLAAVANQAGRRPQTEMIGSNSSAEVCARHKANPDGSPVWPKMIACFHRPIGGTFKGCPAYMCTFNTECGDVVFDGGRIIPDGPGYYYYCVTMHSGPNTTIGWVKVVFPPGSP